MKFNSILEVNNLLSAEDLFEHDLIFDLTESVSSVLENEKTNYRQLANDSTLGSLLDFHEQEIPVVVIPDLHARNFFLKNILNFILPSDFIFGMKDITVFEALQKKIIHLVFLGDALHSEKTTRLRWLQIEDEFNEGIFSGPNMKMEMTEGLSLLMGLYYLKISFPENFHFLKGNHENVLNANFGGDFAFRKYADEGNMVKNFLHTFYGDDILYLISVVENELPLVCFEKNAVISHAEPRRAFSRDELVNARLDGYIVQGLIWTDNGTAQEGSAAGVIKNLFGRENENCIYLAGHRSVTKKYNVLQNGRFIQIHNPLNQNVALVYPGRKFNPEEDIKTVLR